MLFGRKENDEWLVYATESQFMSDFFLEEINIFCDKSNSENAS